MTTSAVIEPPNTATSDSATRMPGSASLTLTMYMTKRVDASAEIAADQAEADADQAGDQRGAEPDDQRDAGAVDDAAQVIAPERVGAERMRPAAAGAPDRLDQAGGQVLLIRIIRSDQRREHRDHDNDEQPGAADEQAAVAQRAPAHDRESATASGRPRRRCR